MPAKSVAQRKYFGWMEHAPEAKAQRKASGMTHQQMHDFASTPDKGLPAKKKKKFSLTKKG